MKTIKRAVIIGICLLCSLILISYLIIYPSFVSENSFYKDKNLRKELAGDIDFLVVGASHGLNAFDTRILDQMIVCNSYNLSGSMMSLYGKYHLLEKELSRNPVKTVVLEISYDTLTRDQRDDYSGGDTQVLERLDSFSERLSYVVQNIPFDDWLNIYSRLMRNGIIYWEKEILGKVTNGGLDKSLKGFYPKSSVDVTIEKDIANSCYDKTKLCESISQENLALFQKILELCKQKNTRIILAVVPLADALIFEGNNWDDFYEWIKNFSEINNYDFFDFNLQRDRYQTYSDQLSYSDVQHLSEVGAEAFTKSFCEILQAVDRGEDVHDRFYASYAEMKFDSPYMKYLEY